MEKIKQKILLALFAGIALSYCYTPSKRKKIISEVDKEWKKIDEKILFKKIKELYRSKLINKKENKDGSITFKLTDKGKIKTLKYYFEEIKIKKGDWDNKWRLVIFDIPEKKKNGRNALREKIKELGFYELQKSVFVYPYECKDEIDFIVEFFELRKYVRFCILDSIDNEFHLKKIFKLM